MHDLESVRTMVNRILNVAGIITFLTPTKLDDQVLVVAKALAQNDAALEILVALLNGLDKKDQQNPQIVGQKFMELVK